MSPRSHILSKGFNSGPPGRTENGFMAIGFESKRKKKPYITALKDGVLRQRERNYIHTLGYSARPSLCGWWLKDLSSRVSAASLKTFSNNSDAALISLRGEESFFLVFKLTSFGSRRRASFFFPALKNRVSKGQVR